MDPADEAAIGLTVTAFYSAFDNRSGGQPDARLLREILSPKASITRVSGRGAETWTVDEFIEPRLALLTGGSLRNFHEWEVAGRNIGQGSIASRWSEYEKTGTLDGAEVRGAGRKLLHLHRAGDRWVIASVLWEDLE